MNKYLILLIGVICWSMSISAQEDETCSELGIWLWRFENTGQPSHTNLARTIVGVGGQRIYVKVADGGYDATAWTTLLDEDLVQTYLDEGIQPWAWSYNYQGNVVAQAEALYLAAKTGYQGFVIDIEVEFNGESQTLDALMKAFYEAKQRAVADGYAAADFPLYVTTWGNPMTHNYRIDIIDQYVDGYMPQTYIEEWSGEHLTMIEDCIEESKLEYQSLGATKPVHNILSTAQQILTPEEITHFFQLSGPEASLWRVPGGGVSQTVWDRWHNVDWEINFCQNVSAQEVSLASQISIYPNPVGERLHLEGLDNSSIESIQVYRQDGTLFKSFFTDSNTIDVQALPSGMYYIMIQFQAELVAKRFIKL